MADGAVTGPRWSAPGTRDPDEIERVRAFRAERAMAHFSALAHGGTDRHCPICSYHGPFSPVRHKPEIWCPSCDSRPRHRLMKLWMDREMALPPGARVLHFAAEAWVRPEMERRGAVYETADINDRFDRVLDIEAIALPDASRDMVIANHVLEHVDDRAALAEIGRILGPGGLAVITVPMIEGWDTTHEDATLDAEGRRLRYGDPDHRRFYGRDLRDRIRDAGLTLAEFAAVEPDVSTHALNRGERLFIGVKPRDEGVTHG